MQRYMVNIIGNGGYHDGVHSYVDICDRGGSNCPPCLDITSTISEARKQGAQEEREAMWKWLCDEASRPDSKDQTVAYNQGARDALNYVKKRFKSRGASEPRCTCNPHDVTYKGHSPGCPRYKPPKVKTLEKLYSSEIGTDIERDKFNFLVGRVNEHDNDLELLRDMRR